MSAYPVIAFSFLLEFFATSSQKYYVIIKNIYILISTLYIINLILMIINPNLFGAYTYFIGIKNQLILGLIVGLFCVYIVSVTERKWYLLFNYSIICFVTLWIPSSGNNLISLFIIFLSLILRPLKKFFNRLGTKGVFLFYGVLFMLVVIYRAQNLFAFVIKDILNKDLTLTNRTYIWDIALQLISKRPLLGYGVGDSPNFIHLYLNFSYRISVNSYVSAHNQLIQLLYEGGAITVIALTMFILVCSKQIKKSKQFIFLSSICILGILIVMLAEAPGLDSLLILLILSSKLHLLNSSTKYNKVIGKLVI